MIARGKVYPIGILSTASPSVYLEARQIRFTMSELCYPYHCDTTSLTTRAPHGQYCFTVST